MTARVMLVEDHLPLRLSLAASLRAAGWEVEAVASAEEADQLLALKPPDVVVLDWNLPGRPGIELLRDWRQRGVRVPVVLLTARDAVGDRVRGLEGGAQDYVVKPFATEELLARVRVQLRDRVDAERLVRLDGCVVDLGRHRVEVEGVAEPIPLTTKEAELLAHLVERPRRTVEREDLLRAVWGYAPGVQSRTIDNTVLRLRAKIERDPARPRHVVTVHGVGYRFEP